MPDRRRFRKAANLGASGRSWVDRLSRVRSEPRIRLLDLGQIAIGVRPSSEKVVVGGGCLGHVASEGVRLGDSVQRVTAPRTFTESFIKRVARFLPLFQLQIRV